MRIASIIMCAVILFIAAPAFADHARDFINSEVAEWNGVSDNNNYSTLGNYIGTIGEGSVYFEFDLAPGTYHFYCSGGMNMEDLDVYVYSETGRELGSDTLPDKIPIVVIVLNSRTKVNVEFIAYSFKEGYSQDYFCTVVAAEGEGALYGFSGDAIQPNPDELVIIPYEDVDYSAEYSDEEFYEYEIDYSDYSDEDFLEMIQTTVDDWKYYEEDGGFRVIETDYIRATEPVHSIYIDLDPAVYKIYAMPDNRCLDLDITIYNENGEVITEDHMDDMYPYVELYLAEKGKIQVDLEVYSLAEDADVTYVAYMVAVKSGLDDKSRLEYIQKEYDWLTYYINDTGEILVDSGIGTLSTSENSMKYQFDLEDGLYYIEAEGGITIQNLDMFVYDENGELIDSDEYDDNFPIIFLVLEEPSRIKLEIKAVEFVEGFNTEYFAYLVSKTEYDPSYDINEYTTPWSGDEAELIENAELLSQWTLDVTEEWGDEILEMETVKLVTTGEENGWSHYIDVSPGTYHIYAQGDDICVYDIDMVIYDENGEIVDYNEEGDNYPSCSIVVDNAGGTYEVVIYAYYMECEVGYFTFILTKES